MVGVAARRGDGSMPLSRVLHNGLNGKRGVYSAPQKLERKERTRKGRKEKDRQNKEKAPPSLQALSTGDSLVRFRPSQA